MHTARKLITALTGLLVATTLISTPAEAGLPNSAEDDPYRPDVVVAKAADGKQAHFPDLIKLSDGRLLAAYREGTGHAGQDGRVLVTDSADGGQTWSTPRLAAESPADERDPKLVQLSDGTILLNYFVIDWKPTAPHTVVGTFVIRSTDGGMSWSAPTKIASRMDGASDQTDSGYRLGWNASHGAITELPGGDLLAPLYGTLPDDRRQQATVVRSTDRGATWSAETEVTLALGDGIHYQEPVLTVLQSGQVVALIRATDGRAWLARSDDNGRTFSEAVQTEIPASSHHLLRLTNGDVLVTYGDLSSRFSPRRETVGRLIREPMAKWEGQRDVLLYDSGHGDQANPSSAEVRPGVYLTLSFDFNNGTIVGVYSRFTDYLDEPPVNDPTLLDLAEMQRDGRITVDTDMMWTDPRFPNMGPLGAIDGSSDYWHAASSGRDVPPDSSYTVTFAKPQPITEVGVTLKPGYRESATLQVSSDGENWRDIATYEWAITTGLDWTTFTESHLVRAIRVVVTEAQGWGQLTELAVRGADSATA